MPGNKPKGHQKLGVALKLLEKAPMLLVPQAMRAVEYLQPKIISICLEMERIISNDLLAKFIKCKQLGFE